MTAPISANLAVEDPLTEALYSRILSTIPTRYSVRTIYNRGGYGYLRQNIRGFNHAAKGIPFLVGTDLDASPCPAFLIETWLGCPKHHNLLLRVAVREAEAWVLADKDGLARFLGVEAVLIPDNVESIPDPKQKLINLASRCRNRRLREDLCPRAGSTAKVGPNYNSRLGAFVQQQWNPDAARLRAPSLSRTIDRLVNFVPRWPEPL